MTALLIFAGFSTVFCLAQDSINSSDNWPGFRGTGNSVSNAKTAPIEWSPNRNIAWKANTPGYGQSSPVVWNNQVFVTSIEGASKENLLVHALGISNGTIGWSRTFTSSQKGRNNPMMSRAAPTPVVDEKAIYAFFESGDLIALSHSGETLWKTSLASETNELKNNHGLGCSPAQTSNCVILLIDHAGPSFMMAINKKTGEKVWKTTRASRSSWTSPTIATIKNREVVVASSSGSLDVYDAATGKSISTYGGLTGNTIPSPCVVDDKILIGSGENRMNQNLAASRESNCCITLKPDNSEHSLTATWKSKKMISHHASPIGYKDHAYFIDKTGILYCLNIHNGEERYSMRLPNQQWATPVAAANNIYLFGKEGVTTVIEAGPEWKLVSTNLIWSEDTAAQRQEASRKAAKAEDEKRSSSGENPSRGNPTGGRSRGPGGGPPLPAAELEATRYSAVGDVIYGAAIVNNAIFIRSGNEVFCIRNANISGVKK